MREGEKLGEIGQLTTNSISTTSNNEEAVTESMSVSPNGSLECLVAAMKALEKKTRECYSETFAMGSDDFVQMMVIDGCFIVELLRLFHNHSPMEPLDDPIFINRRMVGALQRDLLMLHNQFPLFVLQELFKLTSCPKQDKLSLVELILKFFRTLFPGDDKENMTQLVDPNIQYEHLLDMFRPSFISPIKNRSAISLRKEHHQTSPSICLVQERRLIPSATKLEDVGVKFMSNEHTHQLDTEYENGVLKLPPLYFINNTILVYLNFMAYELFDLEAEPYFTNHFMFFDSLVDSAEDAILHDKGIINQVLGSDENMLIMIKKPCREIVYDVEECHLSKQLKGVNDFYNAYNATKWHVWLTSLKRDYLSSPWKAAITFFSRVDLWYLCLFCASQIILVNCK